MTVAQKGKSGINSGVVSAAVVHRPATGECISKRNPYFGIQIWPPSNKELCKTREFGKTLSKSVYLHASTSTEYAFVLIW